MSDVHIVTYHAFMQGVVVLSEGCCMQEIKSHAGYVPQVCRRCGPALFPSVHFSCLSLVSFPSLVLASVRKR